MVNSERDWAEGALGASIINRPWGALTSADLFGPQSALLVYQPFPSSVVNDRGRAGDKHFRLNSNVSFNPDWLSNDPRSRLPFQGPRKKVDDSFLASKYDHIMHYSNGHEHFLSSG